MVPTMENNIINVFIKKLNGITTNAGFECALKTCSCALVPAGGAVPVHGQLGHQRHVVLLARRLVLILQEVEVQPVDCQPFPPEVVALVVLIQLLQRLLQLRRTHNTQSQLVSSHLLCTCV